MKRNVYCCMMVLFAHVLLSCMLVQAAEKQTEVELKARTERDNATYAIGEPVVFLVELEGIETVPENAKISWELSKDKATRIQSGDAMLEQGKARINAALDEAGFLYLEVAYVTGEDTIKAAAGAAVAPLEIAPSLPAPDDFEEFWTQQKAMLSAIPLNIRLTEVTDRSTDEYQVFDVQADCVGDVPMSGYLVRPRGAELGTLPAILAVQGAGVRNSSPSTRWASLGFISLNINAHGLPNGQPAEFYQNLRENELRGYSRSGRESRETSYFRGMFLRVIRALDVLTEQPEWDGRTLVVYGGSQGGAQAIAAAGLDERVTFIVAGVAAMCDHTGMVANRAVGWPRWVVRMADGTPDPQMLEASRYYDMVNFASCATIPGAFTVGFIDRTCAPTSVYAMYNAWQGDKKIFDDVYVGHSYSREATRFMRNSVLEHVEDQRSR